MSYSQQLALPTVAKVVALAGRRPDGEQSDQTSFPSTNRKVVRQRLHALFQRESYTTLVSSAACGADLLAIGAALELGMHTFVVLPFAPEVFRRLSVTDRPGDWGELFDSVVKQTSQAGTLRVLNYLEDDPDAFLKTNQAMVSLAKSQSGTYPVVCILVWDGQSKGEEDTTQQFGHLCRQAGFPVLEVSTLQAD